MSPKIHPSFWSDKTVENLPHESKLVLLWLISNSQTNLLGVCELSERRFAFETGLPVEALQRAIVALNGSIFHKDGRVFLRNYIRHQFGVGDKLTDNNIFKSIKSHYESIKDADLRKEILKEYSEFSHVEEGLTKGFKAQREREGERKGEGTELAEEIYSQYPRKAARAAGIKAILKALKKTDSVKLREKTIAFAASVKGSDPKYIPHAATWFNQERYNDEIEPVKQQAQTKFVVGGGNL